MATSCICQFAYVSFFHGLSKFKTAVLTARYLFLKNEDLDK